MQFDSLSFIVFFIVISSGFYLTKSWSLRKNILLVGSYIFYAAWNPLFLPLLIFISVIDWFIVNFIQQSKNHKIRKMWLSLILMLNLGLLVFFKYIYFLADIVASFGNFFGVKCNIPSFSIILPIGISFYVFHSLSYAIDIYKNKLRPTSSLRDYMLYVGFFPQLVAGPIVRWSEMREQIESPAKFSLNYLGFGIALMIVGVFQKVVLADAVFSPVSNHYFSNVYTADFFSSWVGILAFSGQIFCDFSGYTTCALGAALVLGFRLPLNFHNPYAAKGFSDFWRRWHISLSSWLRDYLYFPLGGSKGGALKTARNLMITMLLGGLWHGAAWTFVIWGGIHGVLLIVEKALRYVLHCRLIGFRDFLSPLLRLSTFLIIALTWVWFRSGDVESAWHATLTALSPSLLFDTSFELSGAQWLVLIAISLLLAVQYIFREKTLIDILGNIPMFMSGIFLALLLSAIILSPGESNAFIYFQF